MNRIQHRIILYKNMTAVMHTIIFTEISRMSSLDTKQNLFTLSLIYQTDRSHPKRCRKKLAEGTVCGPTHCLVYWLYSLSLFLSLSTSCPGAYNGGQPTLIFAVLLASSLQRCDFRPVSPHAAWRNFQVNFSPGQILSCLSNKQKFISESWVVLLDMAEHTDPWVTVAKWL